tara:strand:- start:6911 stop:8827 length:1917 start_codon:yes stop_codon:yes gene_type:complete
MGHLFSILHNYVYSKTHYIILAITLKAISMEEIYSIIIEYKNQDPLIFWSGIVLVLTVASWIIIYQRGRRKLGNKKQIVKSDNKQFVSLGSSRKSDEERKAKFNEPLSEPKTEYVPSEKETPPRFDGKESSSASAQRSFVKEDLPKAKIETDRSKNTILRVDYTSSKPEQTNYYPIFRYPKQDTVVRSYRIGSSKRRGYKEVSFQKSLQEVFGRDFFVSGELRINTGKDTRPFEPDIALIDKKKGNVRIDIEIDEPYAGITRQPTHCKGDDTMRDIYFVDRGWIVIRFSEYQVHLFEKDCLGFISSIIKAVLPSFMTPSSLLGFQSITSESVWDVVQAQKWERERYREEYLNHEFGKIEEIQETIERDFNEQEENEEKLVEATIIGSVDKTPSIGFNLINAYSRDKRVDFYPEPHIYTIDKAPAPSASTIISKFFPEFDSYGKASTLSQWNPLYGLPVDEIVETWETRGLEAANKGTLLHEQIEKYYLGQDYKKTEEFHLFEQFVADHPNISPYRSEWRVFDEEHHIAGTIDLISKNGSGYDIYDWKRSKKVIDTSTSEPITQDSWGNTGVGQLSDIDDTSYNRYCLQQSLYRFILEKNYNLRISNMFLVVLYPDYNRYYKVAVPYQKSRIEYVLRTL